MKSNQKNEISESSLSNINSSSNSDNDFSLIITMDSETNVSNDESTASISAIVNNNDNVNNSSLVMDAVNSLDFIFNSNSSRYENTATNCNVNTTEVAAKEHVDNSEKKENTEEREIKDLPTGEESNNLPKQYFVEDLTINENLSDNITAVKKRKCNLLNVVIAILLVVLVVLLLSICFIVIIITRKDVTNNYYSNENTTNLTINEEYFNEKLLLLNTNINNRLLQFLEKFKRIESSNFNYRLNKNNDTIKLPYSNVKYGEVSLIFNKVNKDKYSKILKNDGLLRSILNLTIIDNAVDSYFSYDYFRLNDSLTSCLVVTNNYNSSVLVNFDKDTLVGEYLVAIDKEIVYSNEEYNLNDYLLKSNYIDNSELLQSLYNEVDNKANSVDLTSNVSYIKTLIDNNKELTTALASNISNFEGKLNISNIYYLIDVATNSSMEVYNNVTLIQDSVNSLYYYFDKVNSTLDNITASSSIEEFVNSSVVNFVNNYYNEEVKQIVSEELRNYSFIDPGVIDSINSKATKEDLIQFNATIVTLLDEKLQSKRDFDNFSITDDDYILRLSDIKATTALVEQVNNSVSSLTTAVDSINNNLLTSEDVQEKLQLLSNSINQNITKLIANLSNSKEIKEELQLIITDKIDEIVSENQSLFLTITNFTHFLANYAVDNSLLHQEIAKLVANESTLAGSIDKVSNNVLTLAESNSNLTKAVDNAYNRMDYFIDHMNNYSLLDHNHSEYALVDDIVKKEQLVDFLNSKFINATKFDEERSFWFNKTTIDILINDNLNSNNYSKVIINTLVNNNTLVNEINNQLLTVVDNITDFNELLEKVNNTLTEYSEESRKELSDKISNLESSSNDLNNTLEYFKDNYREKGDLSYNNEYLLTSSAISNLVSNTELANYALLKDEVKGDVVYNKELLEYASKDDSDKLNQSISKVLVNLNNNYLDINKTLLTIRKTFSEEFINQSLTADMKDEINNTIHSLLEEEKNKTQYVSNEEFLKLSRIVVTESKFSNTLTNYITKDSVVSSTDSNSAAEDAEKIVNVKYIQQQLQKVNNSALVNNIDKSVREINSNYRSKSDLLYSREVEFDVCKDFSTECAKKYSGDCKGILLDVSYTKSFHFIGYIQDSATNSLDEIHFNFNLSAADDELLIYNDAANGNSGNSYAKVIKGDNDKLYLNIYYYSVWSSGSNSERDSYCLNFKLTQAFALLDDSIALQSEVHSNFQQLQVNLENLTTLVNSSSEEFFSLIEVVNNSLTTAVDDKLSTIIEVNNSFYSYFNTELTNSLLTVNNTINEKTINITNSIATFINSSSKEIFNNITAAVNDDYYNKATTDTIIANNLSTINTSLTNYVRQEVNNSLLQLENYLTKDEINNTFVNKEELAANYIDKDKFTSVENATDSLSSKVNTSLQLIEQLNSSLIENINNSREIKDEVSSLDNKVNTVNENLMQLNSSLLKKIENNYIQTNRINDDELDKESNSNYLPTSKTVLSFLKEKFKKQIIEEVIEEIKKNHTKYI